MPTGTSVAELIACMPTLEEAGVEPMDARVVGLPPVVLGSMASPCNALLAAATYVIAVDAAVAVVVSDTNPLDPTWQLPPVHDPANRKFDRPVREVTERKAELSAEFALGNAVNAEVVVTFPAAFPNAITFPEAAVAPPLPGAVAGGAL